jgi:hypothetical protein
MNEKLKDLVEKLEAVSDDARNMFGHLSTEQLNWKPSPESWSAGQCFDHLVVAHEEMLSRIERRLRAGEKPAFFEKIPLLPRLFGSVVVNAVAPETARKIKNPGIFDPAKGHVAPDVVEKFLANQEKVAASMTASENIDLEKTIMTSPVAVFVTYSVLDGYRVIVGHGQRHLDQAKRVTETPGFPGKV